MNFHSILTDLFGSSLMSRNPHQEVVDDFDARRHGGGMGVWLGIWTWCWIGSLGVGFLVGAGIIDTYPPAWGFYVSIITIAVVLVLNVVCPEVRRSAYRRSVAEVRTGEDISRRVARGEIMMHRVKTGPKWWGQEVYHGVALSFEMLRQPGFSVLTVYSAWIYAQVVLIIILLGSLVSRFYRMKSTEVGLFVGCMALGALLAIPFQKANIFSRSRQAQLNNNLATLDRKVAWSSHLVRRTVFTLVLPLAGICYAAVSSGPPMHVSIPTMFSAFVGFFSSLAISECNGLVMEAFDCSDLSPGMTGRQRGGSGRNQKRTNYSSFPRVTAGFASIHAFAFVFAAGSTALGGHITRTLGQQVATGVVAGILLVLTVLLLLVLLRFTEVQIVPKSKSQEMDRLVEARRRSTIRRVSMPNNSQAIIDEERAWRPAMIGNPTSKKRRMNIFELGSMTRWQEIRKKNKLIDAGAHLNREAWDKGMDALDDQLSDFRRDAHELWHGKKRSARKLRRTDESSDAGQPIEMRNLEEPEKVRRRECALSRSSNEGSDGNKRRGKH
ncbi:Major facilitator superfamily domain, general substrate transporter [Metarhizium rileyi]|nr:Major facilitator superfamily domain, general substrate transporter [Metarhizium rileyi RCEF 4871]